MLIISENFSSQLAKTSTLVEVLGPAPNCNSSAIIVIIISLLKRSVHDNDIVECLAEKLQFWKS